MGLLYRIVYAAHANGTHHKLALDALAHLQSVDSDRWQNLFLKYAKLYLEGSKAPDNTFKDFKNHVLHVRDDYWGGAPEKAQEWYSTWSTHCAGRPGAMAAYAAGVLSHYYTDPLQPFHTAQTEAENKIHRAAEWSISSPTTISRKLGERTSSRSVEVEVPAGDRTGWRHGLPQRGHGERLLREAHRALRHPARRGRSAGGPRPDGARVSRRAHHLCLDRVCAHPRACVRRERRDAAGVSLTVAAFLATLQMPAKWVEKKLTNAEDRALVLDMYHELQATGRVEATLPEDDRTVRNLYETEVAARRAVKQAAARAERLAKSAPAKKAAIAVPRLLWRRKALLRKARRNQLRNRHQRPSHRSRPRRSASRLQDLPPHARRL